MIYYEFFKLWKSEVVIILKHKRQILWKYTFGYVTDIIIDNIRWSTSEFFSSAIKGAHTNKNINDRDFEREMKKKNKKNIDVEVTVITIVFGIATQGLVQVLVDLKISEVKDRLN